ncbi:uncharacterized protein [Dermacentor albipictus]|uniref:uncharacterized protein n=1 Tax=Dermacentor albipictus TaxID=60249 RepID=UPI0038FC7DBA
MRVVVFVSLPFFALCNEHAFLKRRSLMSPENEYIRKEITDLCGKTMKLAATEMKSAVLLECNRLDESLRDCKWTVTTAVANQSVVVSYTSHSLRTSLFSEICIDYVKVSHRNHSSVTVCGNMKNVEVHQNSVNFTLHLNPTWAMEMRGTAVSLYVTAGSLPSSMGKCANGSFFCATSGICIWEGFICDNVANCLDYDDEHWFYGSTCVMPMLALELIIFGLVLLFLTMLAFCALLRDIIKDYKLASVHMERDPMSKRDLMQAKRLEAAQFDLLGSDEVDRASSATAALRPRGQSSAASSMGSPSPARGNVSFAGGGDKCPGEDTEPDRRSLSKCKRRFSVVTRLSHASLADD